MNRKKWSKEEKVTIVLEMVKGEESIASICTRHGVSATQAYRWQEQFLDGGRAALGDRRRRGSLDPLASQIPHYFQVQCYIQGYIWGMPR